MKILNQKLFYLLIFTLLLIIGVFLRGYNLFVPVVDWHSFRQADTISVSRVYWEEGVDILRPRYHDISTTQSGLFNPGGYRMVELPLYNIFVTSSRDVFPSFTLEAWGRMISILSTIISSYFIFLITKRFINKRHALLSVALYLTIPFNVYFTRVILPEPTALMFALGALWFFVDYIKRQTLPLLILSAVFMSIALLIKPFIFFYSFPMIYLLVRKTGLRGLFRLKYFVFSLIILTPFVLWRNWIGQFPEGIPFWKWTLNGDGIRFKPAFFRWLFSERIGKLILGVWGVFIFMFGLSGRNKNARFFQSLIVGAFTYMSIFATANVRHDYYQTIIVPVVVMVFSYGTFRFLNTNLGKSFKLLSISVVVFLMLITTVGFVKEFYKINRPEIIKAGLATRKHVPKDSLIIAPYNGDTAFLYQTRRKGWPVVDLPIDQLIERGAEYFVSVDLNHYQTVEFSDRFEEVLRTDQYVILKLI